MGRAGVKKSCFKFLVLLEMIDWSGTSIQTGSIKNPSKDSQGSWANLSGTTFLKSISVSASAALPGEDASKLREAAASRHKSGLI